MSNDYKTLIEYIEDNSKYVSKIVYKESEPVPIGIVSPRYNNQQDEAIEEAEQYFNEKIPLELWPSSWMKPND